MPAASLLVKALKKANQGNEMAPMPSLLMPAKPSKGTATPRHSPATDTPPADAKKNEHDSCAVTTLADIVDRSLHATTARFTLGLSPAALAEAYLDWATHLAFSAGRQPQLIEKASRKALRFSSYLRRCGSAGGPDTPCITPLPQDHRFSGEDWQSWPSAAPQKAGSWWVEWVSRLRERSGAAVPLPATGAPGQNPAHLQDAPGAYVLQD